MQCTLSYDAAHLHFNCRMEVVLAETVAMAKVGTAVELHLLQFCCMRQTVCCSTENYS